MTKKQILGTLAIWIMILPFLGFPGSWKTPLFFITGLVIFFIVISDWLKKTFYNPKENLDKPYSNDFNDTFSEKTPDISADSEESKSDLIDSVRKNKGSSGQSPEVLSELAMLAQSRSRATRC